MGSFGHIAFAGLLAIGAIGFFSVLFVVPPNFKYRPRRLALAMRALSCAIGCGYLVMAYLITLGTRSYPAVIYFLVVCTTLNLIVLAVERPWSRRGPPATTKPG
jgi:hypothetical protein